MEHELSTSYNTVTTRQAEDQAATARNAVERLLVIDTKQEILRVDGNILSIIGEVPEAMTFVHPVLLGDRVIIDARPFINRKGELRVSADYNILRRRALVELYWSKEPLSFSAHADLLVDAFSSWFSNGLAMRNGMDIRMGVEIKVLAAIYYLGLLQQEYDITEEDITVRLLRLIPRHIRVPAQLVDELITEREIKIASLYIGGWNRTKLQQLVGLLNEITNDTYGLTIATIMNSLVKGAFVMGNAPEHVAVGIEHPPVFALMVDAALGKGIQSKTTIGRSVMSVFRKHDSDAFQTFIKQITLEE